MAGNLTTGTAAIARTALPTVPNPKGSGTRAVSPGNAVKAGLEILEVMKEASFAGIALRTRIGINTGEVIAGNIGTGDRINYTVHGDAVNLAARLEQLNKEHGTLMIVSESTKELLTGEYPIEPLGEVQIRGKSQPVEIFKAQ